MYKIGDSVWLASCKMQKEAETCPICFGKLKVKLTLGNGDEVVLPCEFCGKGYEYPTGIYHVYKTAPRVDQMIITGMRIDGKKVEYISCHRCLDSENTFVTVQDAMARAEEIAKERQLSEDTRAYFLKENQKKNYSWNAGYHLRLAKKDRTSAERHERLAILCKAKVRKQENNK